MRARGQSSSGVRFCNVAYFHTSGAFGNTGRAVCSRRTRGVVGIHRESRQFLLHPAIFTEPVKEYPVMYQRLNSHWLPGQIIFFNITKVLYWFKPRPRTTPPLRDQLRRKMACFSPHEILRLDPISLSRLSFPGFTFPTLFSWLYLPPPRRDAVSVAAATIPTPQWAPIPNHKMQSTLTNRQRQQGYWHGTATMVLHCPRSDSSLLLSLEYQAIVSV